MRGQVNTGLMDTALLQCLGLMFGLGRQLGHIMVVGADHGIGVNHRDGDAKQTEETVAAIPSPAGDTACGNILSVIEGKTQIRSRSGADDG